MELSTTHWRYATQAPSATGLFKQAPEDFQVYENLGYAFSGDGEHQFILVEKVNNNTAFVAEQLAKYTGLPLRQVTYAGRKDKYALTQQWFGLHAPGKADFDFSRLDLPGVRVLEQHRHNKKLKTGQLKGNRFVIRLKAVSDADAVTAKLDTVKTTGVPNYYGEQRFGVMRTSDIGEQLKGGNLALAERMVNGEAIRNRNKRSMALSALRSWLFNEVISARIEAGIFDTVQDGDALALTGSNSFFINDGSDANVQQRYTQQDLSPTAPLWGAGRLACTKAVAELENKIASRYQAVSDFLANAGLKQERRAIKIWPQQLEWQCVDDTLTISFSLPGGCYATTVLRECINTLTPVEE